MRLFFFGQAGRDIADILADINLGATRSIFKLSGACLCTHIAAATCLTAARACAPSGDLLLADWAGARPNYISRLRLSSSSTLTQLGISESQAALLLT